MPTSSPYRPARDFADLGDSFSDPVQPAGFPTLTLRFRNQRWAERVGLGALTSDDWERHFGCFEPLPDNLPQPLALRYHGHQFDVYNPRLGDGRGFLFAQLRDGNARLLDLGTKGSGTTPYSRGGDGRLTLKGGIREVLATEMLEALGVSTSKSFSLFETGESLYRGDEPSPTRSSVLVRLSHSHVRFGTFQRLLYEEDKPAMRLLLEYCANHLLPSTKNNSQLPLAFMREVSRRSARLCASWMVAGFVHGVLNSDNMVVTGESFDYGPYRFIPKYDPNFVAAYFDHTGLYAFARQPRAVFRNLARLAEALSLLDPHANFQSALDLFMGEFSHARVELALQRLGVNPEDPDTDAALADACWDYLALQQVPYDALFFDWWGGGVSRSRALASEYSAAYESNEFVHLRTLLEKRAPSAPERLAHPYFSKGKPCTLVIEDIEELWTAIADRNDFGPFEAKVEDIRELGSAVSLS